MGAPKVPYEKPVLRKIALAGEETLAIGCKTASTNPTRAKLGAPNCLLASCSAAGS